MNHTETPWLIRQDGQGPAYIGTKGLNIALFCESGHGRNQQNIADAEFVLKAVNYHDRLVSILKELILECASEDIDASNCTEILNANKILKDLK